jgi:ribosome-binding protein aMBF1 (putative translation factor)
MKLTKKQLTAVAAARQKGERRVYVDLTPSQKRAYEKAAKEEDEAFLSQMGVRNGKGKSAAAETISDALKEAIESSGLTHSRISKSSGVSIGVIDRFVSGKRGITLDTASKIAQSLGMRLVRAAK